MKRLISIGVLVAVLALASGCDEKDFHFSVSGFPGSSDVVDYVYSPGYTVTETTVVSEPYYEETVVYDEYYLYP